MFEIGHRGGLGRLGLLRRDDRTVPTPTVLFVHRASRPAPAFAEALLVEERVEDARWQVRVSGSLFASRPPASPDDLPPGTGLPPSVGHVDVPPGAPAQGLALVASEDDMESAKDAPAAFLANGVTYLRHPRDFVDTMARIRERLGPAMAIGITGIATPSNLAVLVYAGLDLVDSSRAVLESAQGRFLMSDGVWEGTDEARAACGCTACHAGEDLRAHNERALHRELLIVRTHLAHGRLRELAEKRVANDPWNTAVLRHLDLRHPAILEEYTSVSGGEMLAYSHESLTRPEVLRFRRRIRERYGKPPSARVLLLLPCSARKPYSSSRSHRRFRDAILASLRPSVVHEVIVTSPLGLIPRELERFYPARAYDIPVTGDWNRDEAAIVTEDLQAFVAANRYDAVVAHLGAEAPIVAAAVPEAILTSGDHPTAPDALAGLARTLAEVTSSFDRVPSGRRFSEEMTNVARFQFGDSGAKLVEGATYHGRFPDVRVIRGGTQVASYTARGMLSLTLDGGSLLAASGAYAVEIEDFFPTGNVFAVGVTSATNDIRVGDDVVVHHQGDVRAVGTARMGWREMVDAERGEAVHVRHVAAPKT